MLVASMKKAEKRKAKEKAKRKELAHRKSESLGQRLTRASRAPVLHCLMSENLFDAGMGSVLFSRELASGQVAYAAFLIDSDCLGVKDVFSGFRPKSEYFEKVYEPLAEQFVLVALPPFAARKLVEGAVEYSRSLGLSPHAEYHHARHIFGDIDPAANDRQFEFGKDGKPFFVSGPRDTPGRIASVIGILNVRLGTGGFDYLVTVDESELPGLAMIGDDYTDDEAFIDDDENNAADSDVIEGSVVPSRGSLTHVPPKPESSARGET
jgi:hypothetical protein